VGWNRGRRQRRGGGWEGVLREGLCSLRYHRFARQCIVRFLRGEEDEVEEWRWKRHMEGMGEAQLGSGRGCAPVLEKKEGGVSHQSGRKGLQPASYGPRSPATTHKDHQC
jgi:hypothetical protein